MFPVTFTVNGKDKQLHEHKERQTGLATFVDI